MKTDTLMSSLREMVKAEVMVTLLDSGAVVANNETKDRWRTQYSRHETVVREGLQMLANEACKSDHARAVERAQKIRDKQIDAASERGKHILGETE